MAGLRVSDSGWRTSLPTARQSGRSVPYQGMTNDNLMHPYTLTVLPCEKPLGHFHCEMRLSGKLMERSDRPHPSETSARESGEKAVERQFRDESQVARRGTR